jgi:signal-transduction protein with cAMP-binding, CBS, and nucleotidyltransferase domain
MADRVRDVMTVDPVTVSSGTPIIDVARQMRDADVGNVIIIDDSHVAGIVTDRDVTVRATAEGLEPASTPVSKICSSDLLSVSPDDSIDKAVTIMRKSAVRRLPVVEGTRPIGIVSLGDLAVERDPTSALADISAAPANR